VRVLVVSSLWPPAVLGGAEIYAARLADELHQRGHEVGAVTFGVPGDDVVATVRPWPYRLDEYVDQPRWRRAAFHARDLYDPRTTTVVRRAIEDFDADVVHSHAIAGLSTSALAAPDKARAAHVHHLHDYWLLCQRSSFTHKSGENCDRRCAECVLYSGTRRSLLRRHHPDLFIAPSAYVARMHDRVDWIRDRVHVLHLPVDVSGAPDRPRRDGPFTFGYIGQLSVSKGVPTLLAAFRELASTGARLLVAGRGALERDIGGEGVTALGWVGGAERDEFWAAIDCLIVPSEWAEPGGTVAVEARARRLPVIAADTGGLVEHIESASVPLLFPPGDVDALTASMSRVVADRDAFVPAPGSSWPTWAEHVIGVERVYEHALAARERTT
jgi:glycosyltransferase involved in cell wall biosynthesis